MRTGPTPHRQKEQRQGEHRELPHVNTRIPEPRTSTSIPAWPAGLIQPSGGELLRWFELWGHPRAAEWAEMGRERMVVDLVRLEVRCRQPLPSDGYFAQLDDLRSALGLATGT